METTYDIKTGDVVKFAKPLTAAEAAERFIVRELQGNRVLVEFICTMNIKPTFVYLLADLVIA